MLLPATLPGAPRGGAQRGRALIERLGLRDVAGLRPHQLSGGEQQRFALARALVGDPSLVLADEPIGNLDATAGDVVLDLLRSIADEGRAVVMVTHQAEATARADRVLRLRRRAPRGRRGVDGGGARRAFAVRAPRGRRCAGGRGAAC